MESLNVAELIRGLGANDDSVRKMAAFKLQGVIGDPSFADIFIAEGGLPELRALALNATGNTLAYSLTSFSRLLELDQGWDSVQSDLIQRLVALVVDHPLVNILRGAMSILVAIVSHPQARAVGSEAFGFRALKPAIAGHPQFLEMLVSRLSSADHALCANALQLINSLMRDAITYESDTEWPKFIRRLQDLGVIKASYGLMQSTGLQDLAHPLLEFQSLTKVLLRKWREIPIDPDKLEHRRALKAIYLAGFPDRREDVVEHSGEGKQASPDKWRRLGFETEAPAFEFDEVGYLGIMDLTDFVRKSEDGFQKLLLEQSTKAPAGRCPVAKASLAVTSILYDHFEVDRSDHEDQQRYVALESRSNFDKVFKPLLLQWSRLHTSALQAFFRLWSTTGAEIDDFDKIEELVRILVEHVVGLAPRTRDIHEIESDLADYELERLRDLQMELLELTHEDAWGHHLRQVKEDLNQEAMQFIKEQRISCLLKGAWFPLTHETAADEFPATPQALEARPHAWRYVRLSHNRRYLHYADFRRRDTGGEAPPLDALEAKIDLSIVSSVVSSVSPATPDSASDSDHSTVRGGGQRRGSEVHKAGQSTTITIHGHVASPRPLHARETTSLSGAQQLSAALDNGGDKEVAMLTLHATSHLVASEWLDGLLLLLNQTPITTETNKLVDFIAKYGLRIRLLNVRFEEALGGTGAYGKEVHLPGREGVDEEFFYDIGGV